MDKGKVTVGAQLKGQQGYTSNVTGQFELTNHASDLRLKGPDDDTTGLANTRYNDAWGGVPRGPRGDRPGFKRSRVERNDGLLCYDD